LARLIPQVPTSHGKPQQWEKMFQMQKHFLRRGIYLFLVAQNASILQILPSIFTGFPSYNNAFPSPPLTTAKHMLHSKF